MHTTSNNPPWQCTEHQGHYIQQMALQKHGDMPTTRHDNLGVDKMRNFYSH